MFLIMLFFAMIYLLAQKSQRNAFSLEFDAFGLTFDLFQVFLLFKYLSWYFKQGVCLLIFGKAVRVTLVITIFDDFFYPGFFRNYEVHFDIFCSLSKCTCTSVPNFL